MTTATAATTTPTTLQAIDPKAAPYDAVVRITATIGNDTIQGSGVLISPDEVLTAGHVSYEGGANTGVATNVVVAPGYDGGDGPLGEYAGTVAHYTAMTNTPGIAFADLPDDVSIIHLSNPVVGASLMAVTPDFVGGAAHATGYAAADGGRMADDVQTIANDPTYPIFDGVPLGAGSSGGPVWVQGADGKADVVGIISSQTGDTSYDVRISYAQAKQIAAWVAADDATPAAGDNPPATTPAQPTTPTQPVAPVPAQPTTPAPTQPAAPAQTATPPAPVAQQPAAPVVTASDGKTGAAFTDAVAKAYAGPVPGLAQEFVAITGKSLDLVANTPNVFLRTGSGDDAISVAPHGGDNVLDGGTGSNFLTGGSGDDTFFVDARGALADVWSTVENFHAGDAATLWGVTASAKLDWSDAGGATGHTGLTLHAQGPGGHTASLTIAGASMADMRSGKIQVASGHDAASGSDYLHLHAN